MLKIWIILAAASCAVSAVQTSQKEVSHGDKLILNFPVGGDKLMFKFANDTKFDIIWQRDGKVRKGALKLSSNSRTLQIDRVTFDYEGTYNLCDMRNKIISSYTVRVKTKRNQIECIPGQTLNVPLEGIKLVDATLGFNNNNSVVILVKNGVGTSPVYINRIKVTNEHIKVLNVNVSDVGRYTLTDNKGRFVSDTTMKLIEYHHIHLSNKTLIALVLLGIPVILCFYCMKRYCTDNSS